MSNKCPACNTTYTKSLSPFGKTWYDCSPCGKTKEDLEKEYENRIQKDIIKFEDVVEDKYSTSNNCNVDVRECINLLYKEIYGTKFAELVTTELSGIGKIVSETQNKEREK